MRTTDKPFDIDKMQVFEAYKAVKSNAGAAGVDGQTIEQFEADLKSNLYKIWNRMSSESSFPNSSYSRSCRDCSSSRLRTARSSDHPHQRHLPWI